MKTQTFELYYNYGGHSGPHFGREEAIDYAQRMIAGDTSRRLTSVECRPLPSPYVGGYSDTHAESTYVLRPNLIVRVSGENGDTTIQ